MLENFFPGVHVLEAANRQAWYFHSMWKCCGNTAQRQPTNLNVSSLGLQPSCSPDLPVSRGRPGVSQDLRVITTDEVRLSTKADARGKGKIADHTGEAAQEMHRISTDTNGSAPLRAEITRQPPVPVSCDFHSWSSFLPCCVRKRLCKRCGWFATTVQSFLACDPAVPVFHRPRTIFSGSSTRYSA